MVNANFSNISAISWSSFDINTTCINWPFILCENELHEIAEILLKLAFTINQSLISKALKRSTSSLTDSSITE
jgi:hypothetical protein